MNYVAPVYLIVSSQKRDFSCVELNTIKLPFCRYFYRKYNQHTRARHIINHSHIAQHNKLLELLVWCKIVVFNLYLFRNDYENMYPCKVSQDLAPCDAPRLDIIRYHVMCSNSCFWVWNLPVSIPAVNLNGTSKTIQNFMKSCGIVYGVVYIQIDLSLSCWAKGF